MDISFKTKISYGLGAFGKDFAIGIVYTFLMYYYTDIVGVSAATVGAIFLIARFWDAVNDPIMGWIVNNTTSRWGKFKPWILIGTISNSIILVLLFSAHHVEGAWLIPYIAITYILWGMTYTLMDIPFWSIVPTLSLDKKEREGLVPYPRFFASFAGFLTGVVILPFVDLVGGDNKAFGFQMFTLVLVFFFLTSTYITLRFVHEKYSADHFGAGADVKLGIRKLVGMIYKNDQLETMLCMSLCYNLAAGILGGFAIYYFTYAMGNKALFINFQGWPFIANLATIFLFPMIAQKFSRRVLWAGASVLPLIGCSILISLAVTGVITWPLVVFAGCFMQVGSALFWVLQVIMVADIVDYGQYKLGVRCESIAYSVQTLVVKAGSAFSAFFIGIGLTTVGYLPNVVQSSETITKMHFMMIGAPSAFFILTLVIYFKFYKLNGGYLQEIQDELMEKYNKASKTGPDDLKCATGAE